MDGEPPSNGSLSSVSSIPVTLTERIRHRTPSGLTDVVAAAAAAAPPPPLTA